MNIQEDTLSSSIILILNSIKTFQQVLGKMLRTLKAEFISTKHKLVQKVVYKMVRFRF